MHMSDHVASVLWRFAPMIYGPTVLFALGEGAVIPLIPVLAAERGADIAQAALVTSFLVIGQLCGNIPAGWAVARFGERTTMALGGALAMLGAGAMLYAPSTAVLALSVFIIGFCAATFGLARHSFMTTRVPLAFRARSLSLLGGSFRLGTFVGPFVAAGLLVLVGDELSAVWFFLGCLVATILLVLLGPDPERTASPPTASAATDARFDDSGEPVSGAIPTVERVGVFRTMWRHRGVLSRLGLAGASLSAIRSARQAVLPLWGLSLGLDAQTIALVVGISGAVDFALFYASGQVMDRFGRLWAALPAMILMGGGFLVLSVTHEFAAATVWFTAIACVLGLGNGLSSGILLTLGADAAPRADPAPFLGSWRTLTDAGGAVAPLIVSALTAAVSLSVATGAMGLLGLAGAAAFIRWVPRFVPRTRGEGTP
jgi:MFS family permease